MEALRQQPHFTLDHEARKQIRETRATILEHLAETPDDFKGLVMADVLHEIDPDKDRTLADHAARFRATRAADWRVQARALGLDRLLYSLAYGWIEARIGRDATVVLERRAAEIGEARAADQPAGYIDVSVVPDELASSSHAQVACHASGHLSRVTVYVDAMHEGELALDREPGTGRFRIIEKRGGYGTMMSETYREGGVVTILNTPWHDGEESITPIAFTRWVEECLSALARIATKPASPAKKKRRKRQPS